MLLNNKPILKSGVFLRKPAAHLLWLHANALHIIKFVPEKRPPQRHLSLSKIRNITGFLVSETLYGPALFHTGNLPCLDSLHS